MSSPSWSFTNCETTTELLTPEEERELFMAMPPGHCRDAWKAWKQGKTEETEAILPWSWWMISAERERLIRANMRLLFSLLRGHAESSELSSHLFVWLIYSVDHFDPAKGHRLSTYASWTMQHQVKNFYRISGKRSTFWDDVSGYPLEESIEDHRRVVPLDLEEKRAFADQAFAVLSERERLAVTHRLGFQTDPKTLAELGVILGVTKERCRQITEASYRKLRKAFGVRQGELG